MLLVAPRRDLLTPLRFSLFLVALCCVIPWQVQRVSVAYVSGLDFTFGISLASMCYKVAERHARMSGSESQLDLLIFVDSLASMCL